MKADRARRRKAEVVAALKEHITEFGERDWGRVLRRFPKISSASFWRYVREARAPEVDSEAEPFIEPAVAELAAQRPRSLQASIRALQRSAARQRERNARFEPDYVETPHEPLSVKPEQLGALMERYAAEVLSHLRTGDKQRRSLRRIIDPLAHVLSTDVSDAMVEEIIDDIAQTAPVHANRILGYFSAFCSWAVGERAMISSRWAVVRPAEERPRDRRLSLEESRDGIHANRVLAYAKARPAPGGPSAAAIWKPTLRRPYPKPTREIARDRTPTIEEVAEIWRAAETLGYPFGHIVQLLILTAARRDEVGAMQLSEPHLPEGGDEGCWTLPSSRSKNGRALRNPLSPLARRVLERALVARVADGPFVFTTTGRTPVSGWSRAKIRLDAVIAQHRRQRGELADMPSWRVHDLRRAFATAACDVLRVDPAVADRCLNHVGAGTTSTVARIYARSEMYDQRRDALNRWAELIAARGRRLRSRASPGVPDRE